ncbi:MAG: zinc metalloprotease HtpX [Elusimicrobiota bacterium]|nr:zinc metalloprotease HtpX [Elusimicrobiota bacterium]
MNTFRTTLLMLALIILFVLVGNLVAGQEGMWYAFFLALMMNGIAYWFSDKIVLMMYGAKEIKESDYPEIFSIIRELTMKMNLPMPKVCIINTPTPNAFATGRNPKNSAVVLTSGIINLLNERELAGVIAHELSHIKNRDTLISVVAATIAGAIFMLARMAQWALMFGGNRRDDRSSGPLQAIGLLVLIILAPIAAMIIQLAISRSREYEADRTAGITTSDPLSLANALRKLHETVQRVPLQEANPTTAHMFIVNPLKGKDVLTLFSTHPPISERIKKLEQLNNELRGYAIPNIVR